MPTTVTIIGIEGLPEVQPGAPLAGLLRAACTDQGTPLQNGDVLVVTQKVVSKAEGQVLDLKTVTPSPLALEYARAWEKDPRVVEIALAEAKRVVRMDSGVLITETKHGFICANSGVDASNVGHADADWVVLLPDDPDASARRLRDEIRSATGAEIAVIISDTFGRPWREGAGNVAIGVAGMAPLWDYRGTPDNDGREMHSTVIAVADEVAAASELVTNKLSRVPAAIIRGYPFIHSEEGIRPMLRERGKDLFR